MSEEVAAQIIKEVDPKYIIFICLGTPFVFKQLMHLKQNHLQSYNVLYPCPSQNVCPLIDSRTDWCHQIILASHHPSIERLSQILHKDRRHLPALIHVYQKNGVSLAQTRLVRVLKETKFSFEWEVCDGENQYLKLQVVKRGLKVAEIKKIRELSPGASVQYKVLKELPGGVLRVKI